MAFSIRTSELVRRRTTVISPSGTLLPCQQIRKHPNVRYGFDRNPLGRAKRRGSCGS